MCYRLSGYANVVICLENLISFFDVLSALCSTLAYSPPTFVADMTTYYCTTIEEALRRVKRAVKTLYPGSYFGGIILRSGRRGFAVYQEGRIVEQYTAKKDR